MVTVEAFLAWSEGQEETYEFVDGHVVVVENGTARHDTLAAALQTLVAAASPCRVYGHRRGLRVRTRVRRPDLLVVCGPVRDDAVEVDAEYVAEVLSTATARADLTVKVHEYKEVPSIRQYLVLDPDVRQGYLFDRHEPRWHLSELSGGRTTFAGVDVDLDDLYDLVDRQLS